MEGILKLSQPALVPTLETGKGITMDKLTIQCAECRAVWTEYSGNTSAEGRAVLRHSGFDWIRLMRDLREGVGEFTLTIPDCTACKG